MSKFRVINRTTRQEHIFNSEEIKRFFKKNLMSDYAISSIKYEEKKKKSKITPELINTINNISWFDGILYIILGLGVYAAYRWIKNKI